MDTTVGATEASKAAIYGSEILFADLASSEVDAATLKINGAAVTSIASELNAASAVSNVVPQLNTLGSAPSTELMNTFSAVTSSAANLNLLDGVDTDLDASDLNKLTGITSTASELNKLSTASSVSQLNTLSTTSTAAVLNTASTVLKGASDGTMNVHDVDVDTLDTTSLGIDLTVSGYQLTANAAKLGSVLSTDIKDFTNSANINSIDKFRTPSTAQLNTLSSTSASAANLNAYATTDRATVTNVNSDFCDNKLPGTLVNKGDDLYFCLATNVQKRQLVSTDAQLASMVPSKQVTIKLLA